MKRVTDKLIALQFLAVVLPIAVVLIVQLVVDARRAEVLEYSRPFRLLAAEARANYKIFTNGVSDAVASGVLGTRSVEALQQGEAQLNALAVLGESDSVSEAAQVVGSVVAAVSKEPTLKAIAPLRESIARGDALTTAVNDDYERRDELVVKGAIASAVRQRQAVIGALIISAILSVVFVRHARRRLKARMDAEIEAERRRRTELETMSVRFGIATSAARAGVYELKEDGLDLWWSDSMYELYGQSPQGFKPAIATWLELIHPADRLSAKNAITAAMLDQSQLRSQYRVVRPDGSERHIASLAAVVTDTVDGSSRLVGIDLDISERIEADERERKLQQQLRDSSRLAGMAEIATNVLHNIGNVLNSVNISATLVTDKIKNSKAAGLGKIAALVQRACVRPRGVHVHRRPRQAPPGVSRPTVGAAHRGSTRHPERTRPMRKNIDHIKEIVVMQQSYSKLVGSGKAHRREPRRRCLAHECRGIYPSRREREVRIRGRAGNHRREAQGASDLDKSAAQCEVCL